MSKVKIGNLSGSKKVGKKDLKKVKGGVLSQASNSLLKIDGVIGIKLNKSTPILNKSIVGS